MDIYIRKMKKELFLGRKDNFYILALGFCSKILNIINLKGNNDEILYFKDTLDILEEAMKINDAIAVLDLVNIIASQFGDNIQFSEEDCNGNS